MTATAETLSALCAEAKKPAARAAIDQANADRGALYALLGGDDPKQRKNAARLLGALRRERDAEALCEALGKEKTLFVIPSILLALGSAGGAQAMAALTGYAAPEAEDPSEQKHIDAIGEALHKARSSLCDEALPRYTAEGPRAFLAVAPAGFEDVLCEEMQRLGFAPKAAPEGCVVETRDWERLLQARCLDELLLPLGGAAMEPEAIAKLAAQELTLPYRIELRGYGGDRADMIRKIRRACGGENNPAHYALELRVAADGTRCALFIKPSFDDGARYPWRKRVISASIKPALGACLARYAARHAADNPRVLDPFCGCGALLFSCEEAFPCASLLGVDISQNAVLAAKENAGACQSRARFIQKDVLQFTPREPAELVISNLPFGNRVGTHGDNRRLYAAFLAKLPALLARGGVALLYTMEYRLLADCLARQPALTRIDARRTEAGGLLPWVFLLKK